jgi:hypothetical protein
MGFLPIRAMKGMNSRVECIGTIVSLVRKWPFRC